ncbi:hypothetical protein ACWDYK_37995 [Streptomyces anthocyanicus]|uniref:hypothetical protein n=1 Tax=Streptomyces anthocyanicus TaxID=68174 RepID=UPI002F911722
MTRRGVALATPHGYPLAEHGSLGGLQLGGAEEVGDLARHVEGDQQLQGRGFLLGPGGVVGQEVGDGGADRAAADPVAARKGGDGAALQIRGADVAGLVGRDSGAASAVAALGPGGDSPSYVEQDGAPPARPRWS